MIKAISAWAFSPQRTAAEMFEMAREAGFDAVEISFVDDGQESSTRISALSTEDDCLHLAATAREAGVQITALANGLGWEYPLTSDDAPLRQRAIDVTVASLQAAQWLGTDSVLVVPGGVGADFLPAFPGEPYEVAYRNLMSALAELDAPAREYNVHICLENVWNKFLLSPLEFRDVLDAAASTHIGCYFDVGNVLLTGYPEQWIHILGSRIKRVHLKDFQRKVGTIDGFCNLLEGDVDFAAVMDALRTIGYDDPLTAEFFDCENDLPHVSEAIDRILEM